MIAWAVSLGLQWRCLSLFPPWALGPMNRCQNAVAHMVKTLDIAVAQNSLRNGFMVFTQAISHLKTHPDLFKPIEELHRTLDRTLSPPTTFQVWPWARHAWGGPGPALGALAALFQDMDGPGQRAAHSLYLEATGQSLSPSGKIIVKLVGYVSSDISHGVLDLLPAFVPPELARTRPYHFLVPAHLAASLRQAGFSKEEAFLGPSLLNTTYELMMGTLSTWGPSGLRRFTKSNPWGWTPALQALWNDEEMAEDIYLGLLGSCWGAQGLREGGPQGVPPWATFKGWSRGETGLPDLEVLCPTGAL